MFSFPFSPIRTFTFLFLHSMLLMLLVGQINLAQAKETFDLKRSLLYAIEKSPVFDSLKHQLSIAELEESSARARFLPSLDLSTVHGLKDTSPRVEGQGNKQSEFNLALTESLYDNGVTYRNYQMAKLTRQQMQWQVEEERNKLAQELANSFINFSLNLQLWHLQEKQEQLLQRQFAMIQRDYYQGMKTKNDFLRFKTQVGRSQIELVNSRGRVDKARDDIKKLLALSPQEAQAVDFTPLSLIKLPPMPEDVPLQVEDHLQFKRAQLQKEIQQLSADVVGKKRWPELFLSSGVNYTSSNYWDTGLSFKNQDQWQWNVLLSLKMNLFDGGTRTRDFAMALEKAKIEQNEQSRNLLALQSTFNQWQISRQNSVENFHLAKELLTLEQTNIDFIEREYRNGKVQFLDLITGLNNLSDAQMKYYNAVSELYTVHFDLLCHQGKLYEYLQK